MGYTHYFRFDLKQVDSQTEKAYQKAIKECAKVIRAYSRQFGGLAGYTAHSEAYGGINVNGSIRVGQCENLILRESLYENDDFNFVKTRQYPYDTVVTACLIILKHRLGTAIAVSSDGRADDWNDGLILAQSVLGLKSLKIPKTIRRNEAKAS